MKSYALALFLLLILTGCKSGESPAPATTTSSAASPVAPASPALSTTSSAPAVKSKVDVCNLLNSDDLKSVQGEAYKEAQRSDRQDGDFLVAQCYYLLPTTVNSVVVNVTTAREGGGRNPRDFWEDTFREADEKDREGKGKAEREREKEKDKTKQGRRTEEEEEGLPPEKVKGLGDEAFWSPSRIGGALYVLKSDRFFRISVGGAGDAASKLSKSKTLAQKILQRL